MGRDWGSEKGDSEGLVGLWSRPGFKPCLAGLEVRVIEAPTLAFELLSGVGWEASLGSGSPMHSQGPPRLAHPLLEEEMGSLGCARPFPESLFHPCVPDILLGAPWGKTSGKSVV